MFKMVNFVLSIYFSTNKKRLKNVHWLYQLGESLVKMVRAVSVTQWRGSQEALNSLISSNSRYNYSVEDQVDISILSQNPTLFSLYHSNVFFFFPSSYWIDLASPQLLRPKSLEPFLSHPKSKPSVNSISSISNHTQFSSILLSPALQVQATIFSLGLLQQGVASILSTLQPLHRIRTRQTIFRKYK